MDKDTSKLISKVCFGSLIIGSLFNFGLLQGLALVGFGFLFFYKNFKKNQVVHTRQKNKRLLDEKTLEYFSNNKELQLNEHIIIKSNQAMTFDELDVYYDQEKIAKVKDFASQFKDTYEFICDKIMHLEVQEETNEVKTSIEEDSLITFKNEIDELNQAIEHTKITEDLYHTSSMLKFLDQIIHQYPDKESKITKLKDFYLPSLISILRRYVRLSKTNQFDPDFSQVESQLIKTVYLVNQALDTLSDTLCDDEIMDISSDMSVLETMLKKEGLVKEGTIYEKGNE